MKSLIMITAICILNIAARAQQNINSSYNAECDLWLVAEGQTQPSGSLNPPFNWQFVTASGNYQMLDVFFIDSLNGWLTHSGNGGHRTTDSGMNWTAFTFNDTNFTTTYNGTFFLNPNTGWCVGGAT